jgi:hypothetical protein
MLQNHATNRSTLKTLLEGTILFLLFVAMTALLIGDQSVRLANTHGDDGPVVYAYFLQNPARFQGDILETYAYTSGLASIQNWLPALLLRAFGLPPEIPALVWVYLQNVLLGFALLRYVRVVTGRTLLALIAVFFAFAAKAWVWNLANYGNIMYIPYAGHLALPFLIFAAASLVEENNSSAVGWMAIGGLVHPSLTLYMVLISGLFWVIRCGIQGWRTMLVRVVPLGLIVGICVAPALIIRSQSGELLSHDEMLSGILRNYHTVPWDLKMWWSHSLPTFLGILGVILLATRYLKEMPSPFVTFWIATTLGVIGLGFVHLAGIFFHIIPFIQLISLRATLLLVMFSLPLVFVYVLEKLRLGFFVERWATVSWIILMAFYSTGAYWVLLLVMFLSDSMSGYVGIWRVPSHPRRTRYLYWVTCSVMVLWVGLLFTPTRVYAWVFGSRLHGKILFVLHATIISEITIPYRLALLAILAAAAIFALLLFVKVPLPLLPSNLRKWFVPQSFSDASIRQKSTPMYVIGIRGLLLVLIAFSLYLSWQQGLVTTKPRYHALYDAQRWAREETPPETQFIFFVGNWRTISQRRVIIPREMRWYTYSGSKRAMEFDDQYLNFYGLKQEVRALPVDQAHKTLQKAYYALDEEDFIELSHRFGGDYIVQPTTHELDFPIAYRNEQFIIYDISFP